MKQLFFITMFLLVFSVSTALGATQHPNAINIGGKGLLAPDLTATDFSVEYERLLGRNFAIVGRLSYLDYEYDDGDYIEEGSGPGLEIGARLYPGSNGFNGFFFGAFLGLWDIDWDWIDDVGQSYQSRGNGSSTSISLALEAGGRIPLGTDRLHLIPSVTIGHYFSLSSDDDHELGFFGVLGLGLGFTF
jgi:hypothetical protein